MTLSAKKSAMLLRPWWDVAFSHGLLVLLAIGVLLLVIPESKFTTVESLSNKSSESQRSLTKRHLQDDEEIQRTTKSNEGMSTNVPLSSTSVTRRTNPGNPPIPGAGQSFVATTEFQKIYPEKARREISFDEPSTGIVSKNPTLETLKRNATGSYILFMFLFAGIWIVDRGFHRIFYTNFFLQSVCGIAENLTDIQRDDRNSMNIHATSLHHTSDKNSLYKVFWIQNVFRVSSTIFTLALVSKYHDPELLSYGEHFLEVSMQLILGAQIVLCFYSIFWPLRVRSTLWGRLMHRYAVGLDKMDVARGHCIPTPPFEVESRPRSNQNWMSNARFSMNAAAVYVASGQVNIQSGICRTERILDANNPYTTNQNFKLILDLMAQRAGIGVALRCLAYIENEVYKNWQPFRAKAKFVNFPNQDPVLEICWYDSLAVIYLNPLQSELKIYNIVEVLTKSPKNDTECSSADLVKVVGYKDRQIKERYRRGTISSQDSNESFSCDYVSDVSIDCCGGPRFFEYQESFVGLDTRDEPYLVTIWTVVDGQPIAKTTIKSEKALANDENFPTRSIPNVIPKPPRLYTTVNLELKGEDSQERSSSEDSHQEPKLEEVKHESEVRINIEAEVEPNNESDVAEESVAYLDLGVDKVIWKKTLTSLNDELEPISIEKDHYCSQPNFILSPTPSDTPFSSDNEAFSSREPSMIKSNKRKRSVSGSRPVAKLKTKSLTSLKLDGASLPFGQRTENCSTSNDKLSSMQNTENNKEGNFLRKAKSAGFSLWQNLSKGDGVAIENGSSRDYSGQKCNQKMESDCPGTKSNNQGQNSAFDNPAYNQSEDCPSVPSLKLPAKSEEETDTIVI